jgi:hypothetical protein
MVGNFNFRITDRPFFVCTTEVHLLIRLCHVLTPPWNELRVRIRRMMQVAAVPRRNLSPRAV